MCRTGSSSQRRGSLLAQGQGQALARGDALLAPSITRRLVAQYVARPAPSSGVPAALAGLTDRELEVLRQRARGRTNAEIATDLYLSPATVKTHVARVLTKLDLRDRVQAVVVAYETGLVEPGRRDSGGISSETVDWRCCCSSYL